ncbi:MAG TPA: hypothetical protein VMF87_23735 [Streptosporangiaceae bacterium]|nr:hypothetical protein [Streptosporangiaceae bacterium]
MSADEERELRRRLGGVLEAVSPSPAPVEATVRRGRLIRLRRQLSVAVGLAVVVGVAVGVPGLLRPVSPEPQGAGQPKVTVDQLGPHAAKGVIGSGTINGRRWRLVVQEQGSGGTKASNECFVASGAVSAAAACYPANSALGGASDPVAFDSNGGGRSQVQYGEVAAGVTRLTVTLAGGTVLQLRPTEAYGQRYVAFAIPLPLVIDRVVAYGNRGEISHAVPFNTAAGDSIAAWLGPGQQGPSRVSRVVGSGSTDGKSWSQTVHAGPWGYCFSGVVGGCFDTVDRSFGDRVASFTGLGGGGTNWAFGTASAAVSYVRVSLSGGPSVRARTFDVGGPRFFAFAIPSGERLVSVGFYTASGHEVSSESAARMS